METLEDSSTPYSTVTRSSEGSKLGRTSTEGEHCEGSQSISLIAENVKKVKDVVLANRRMTVKYIAQVAGPHMVAFKESL